MQNLERKFRCGNLAAAELAARGMGATDRGVIHQRDLFFEAPHARLKLRAIAGREAAELISYRRADSHDARISDYVLAPVMNAEAVMAVLTHALGRPRELAKVRHLFIYKATRIHIDKVDGAGTFVELETVLSKGGPSAEEAERELAEVVAALGLSEAVPEAYVDLLESGKKV
jgi:adenylate cyclase class IV